MARFWYSYNGVGDPILIASYNLTSTKPNCINGGQICAIYTPSGGSSPSVLSTNIRTYIADLQLTLVARPDASPGIKKYVYGRAC